MINFIPDSGEKISCFTKQLLPGIEETEVRCVSSGQTIRLAAALPLDESFSVWQPIARGGCPLHPEWNSVQTTASIIKGAPVHQLVAQGGRNTVTIAVAEPLHRVQIKTGVREETAEIICKITLQLPTEQEEYRTVIRIDTRHLPYEQSLQEVTKWWESNAIPAIVPKEAKEPMYSTWYAFHQKLTPQEILQECRLARQLGMRTVLLDDGWQTDDTHRGYAYCGDWNPAISKVGQMETLVNNLHTEGMRVILWYNLAYVGTLSAGVERFAGMYLGPAVRKCYTLDPRYKEVREYWAATLAKAVRDWKLDGLKLDFIDSFERTEQDLITEKMDIPSLEKAVQVMLEEIYRAVFAINHNILIEFRQNYIGPAMRQYANIFRVADCPADAFQNRLGAVHLRLMAGNTAVHSDMLMWDRTQPPELAARQLIQVLCAVPQISVRLSKLNAEHYEMLKFLLDFWCVHKNLLTEAELHPTGPETNYAQIVFYTDTEEMILCYDQNTVKLSGKGTAYIVNGTASDRVLVRLGGTYHAEIMDCMGSRIQKTILSGDWREIEIPISGVMILKKESGA